MTNKNLKDEEIIKALECCSLPFNECAGCPLYDDYPSCEIRVIDLINRQKAEIERLKSDNEKRLRRWNMLAEKAKRYYVDLDTVNLDDIEKLLKEMVDDEE